PPLPFSEIVGVLTTGLAPSTAPGSIGSQSQVSQSWQQAGATALLGQAISNPLNGRLQRFFGVSQFRIDPETGGSTTTNTAARVTVEQRIANNLSLTYVTDLSRAQAQSVRMELDLTRNWSAVALRDENGEFGVDVQYRKQFK
ncbi:MAG: translocation/assembly module TamB domain-containing protein, partial [Bryobacteraceae bacterium]